MLLMLNVHYTRIPTCGAGSPRDQPLDPIRAYRDGFGNWLQSDSSPPTNPAICHGIVKDTANQMWSHSEAQQHAVEALPDESFGVSCWERYWRRPFLKSHGRGCSATAAKKGWPGVKRILRLRSPAHCLSATNTARATRTRGKLTANRTGVCRGLCSLWRVAFCRCMNIPARYCTGYLGDIGVPVSGTRRWISRPGSKPMSAAVVHVRRAPQHAAESAGRAIARRTGRRRCRDQHDLWVPRHAQQLHG